MLSRLIITFLCAAAIGSVSGAFLTFDPAPVVFENIERPVSFSAKLNSKPTKAVTVHLEHPFMSMSKCMIVFRPNNWNVSQTITGIFAPLLLKPFDPLGPLNSESELLAKAETAGQLPAELSTIDTLKIIRGGTRFYLCSIKKNEAKTFDEISFSFNKPGWYRMMSTRDIEVQVFMDECTARLSCIKKVLARYGPTVMRMDVSGPVKSLREYSTTYVTSSTNGIQYARSLEGDDHSIIFPYGSRLDVRVVNNGGIMSLDVDILLATGYPSPGGLCNRPRDPSPDNRLIGRNGRLYRPGNRVEVDAFTNSWRVKAKDVLTNPGAKKSFPSSRPGTVCTFPENPQPKP